MQIVDGVHSPGSGPLPRAIEGCCLEESSIPAASVWLLSGLVVGLTAGVSARVAMRLVAVAGGVAPGFTVPGTLTVIVVGALYGILGSLVFVGLRGRLPGSGVGKGWVFGMLAWLLYGLPLLIADQVDELRVAPALGLVLFGTIFVLSGPALSLATAGAERFLSRSGRSRRSRLEALLALAILLGAAPAVLSTYVLLGQKIAGLLTSS